MSRRPKRARRPEKPLSSQLTATLRLRRSWTRWRLKVVKARRKREDKRLRLLQMVLDSQHLLIKELDRKQHLLDSSLRELQLSRMYREGPSTQLEQPQRWETGEIFRLVGLPSHRKSSPSSEN